MHEAIEILTEEHRIIGQVLGALESYVETVGRSSVPKREKVSDFAGFFANFADKLHHVKEEDLLFVSMNDFGFPKEYGPIAVMLAEHTEGRKHVGALREIGAGDGELSPQERTVFLQSALAYIPLLRQHIQKENNILYPMAQQALPETKLDELLASYGPFEDKVMGAVERERYISLANSLVAAYPPDPAKMADAQSCVGCAGNA